MDWSSFHPDFKDFPSLDEDEFLLTATDMNDFLESHADDPQHFLSEPVPIVSQEELDMAMSSSSSRSGAAAADLRGAVPAAAGAGAGAGDPRGAASRGDGESSFPSSSSASDVSSAGGAGSGSRSGVAKDSAHASLASPPKHVGLENRDGAAAAAVASEGTDADPPSADTTSNTPTVGKGGNFRPPSVASKAPSSGKASVASSSYADKPASPFMPSTGLSPGLGAFPWRSLHGQSPPTFSGDSPSSSFPGGDDLQQQQHGHGHHGTPGAPYGMLSQHQHSHPHQYQYQYQHPHYPHLPSLQHSPLLHGASSGLTPTSIYAPPRGGNQGHFVPDEGAHWNSGRSPATMGHSPRDASSPTSLQSMEMLTRVAESMSPQLDSHSASSPSGEKQGKGGRGRGGARGRGGGGSGRARGRGGKGNSTSKSTEEGRERDTSAARTSAGAVLDESSGPKPEAGDSKEEGEEHKKNGTESVNSDGGVQQEQQQHHHHHHRHQGGRGPCPRRQQSVSHPQWMESVEAAQEGKSGGATVGASAVVGANGEVSRPGGVSEVTRTKGSSSSSKGNRKSGVKRRYEDMVLEDEVLERIRQQAWPAKLLQMERKFKAGKLSEAEVAEYQKQRKLVKNRESAAISRVRKSRFLQHLEEEVDHLTEENSELMDRIEALEEENANLKEELKSLRQKFASA